MKRSFVYLALALMLCFLLCACGNMTDRGNVSTSPVPETSIPEMSLPSMDVSPTPSSDLHTGDAAQNGTQGSGIASPAPTSSSK